MDLKGKRVILVGLGKSGVAAARLCLAQGATVIGTDRSPLAALSEEARALPIERLAGGHAGVDFAAAELIVVSPGVGALPELERAERAGVEVIGELELACRFVTAPIVAVGGTNGKSTATTLVAALLTASGRRVFAGANLGIPAAEAASEAYDVVVWEVSSFQLERAATFRPRVSVLLNVTEDHLDRYPDFDAYARAKGNAFANQLPQDVAIVPAGDALCEAQARRGRGRVITFGASGDYVLEDRVVVEAAGGARFSLAGGKLHGRHNQLNAAAAIAAARALGVEVAAIEAGLAGFEPLPHRMALVAQRGGVRFYDDSKGTNVGASVTALDGLLEERGVLIAGGRDKHGSYAPLVAALQRKGRAVVLIGEAARRIADAIGSAVPVRFADSLEQAVAEAFRLARPGDAVLLSPACSSFDMFDSYAHRGDCFARAARALPESPAEESRA